MEEFRLPGTAYRSVAFFSLNDQLETGEIRRQLTAFKEAGFGGVFFHSRIGLLDEYLGETWFDRIDAGVRFAGELGLDSWFYDEDKWPSGFAGGIVPRQDSDFLARCLLRVPKNQAIDPHDTLLNEEGNYRYLCHTYPMGDPRFNGTGWVDLLNPKTVEAFLDCTYRPYAERFAGRSRVLGIFTDEPQASPKPKIPNVGALPYSPHVARAFELKTGRDLSPLLPSLFEEVGDWRWVRLEYYRTLAACFESSFSRPIGEFCGRHNLLWTGHYNAEDQPVGGMLNQGGLMQQLRHLDVPGIDALVLRLPSPHCGKVMTSVANQYGRHRRISELFGISGHNLTFEDRVWITAWHTLMGVNLMCPHLSLYSMKGERKRDFPPTISFHQPYWRDNNLFEDYSARLCYFASTGRPVAEICVISPLESDYLAYETGQSPEMDVHLERLLGGLCATHRNSDLGDEQILSEIARVEDGCLVVGEMAYPVVILPRVLTLRTSTVGLLAEFGRQGGTLLVDGELPTRVEGREDPQAIASLKAHARRVLDGKWKEALRQSLVPRFILEGSGAGEVWTHLRTLERGWSLQLSNTSRLRSFALRFRPQDACSSLLLLDPTNGEVRNLLLEDDGACSLSFAPTQTWILLGDTEVPKDSKAFESRPTQRQPLLKLDAPWRGKRLTPNALTLDFARISLDNGQTWSEPEPILAFCDRFADAPPFTGEILLKVEAIINQVPSSCLLAVEQPGMYTSIQVNDHPVRFDTSSYFLDPVLRCIEVSPLLRTGANHILLRLLFTSAEPASADNRKRYGSELESIYLIGDFSVLDNHRPDPEADWESDRNKTGLLAPKPIHRLNRFVVQNESANFSFENGSMNLALQGYPFFSGEFELVNNFDLHRIGNDRIFVSFPNFEAVLIKVDVNGKTLPPLFTSPWEHEITHLVLEGRNTIRIVLTNSLRNLLGPHHHAGGEHVAVGPATFRANNNWPNIGRGESDWYDARKKVSAKSWIDDYFIIPFGFLEAPILSVSHAGKAERTPSPGRPKVG